MRHGSTELLGIVRAVQYVQTSTMVKPNTHGTPNQTLGRGVVGSASDRGLRGCRPKLRYLD